MMTEGITEEMQEKLEAIKRAMRESLCESMVKEGLMFDTAHIDIHITFPPVPSMVQITGVLEKRHLKEGITPVPIEGNGKGNYFYKPYPKYVTIVNDIYQCKSNFEKDYGCRPKGIHLSEKDYQILKDHCDFECLTNVEWVMGIEVLSTNAPVSYLE